MPTRTIIPSEPPPAAPAALSAPVSLRRHGSALGVERCYACDDDARGTRDRSFDAERAIVPACTRHMDRAAEAA